MKKILLGMIVSAFASNFALASDLVTKANPGGGQIVGTAYRWDGAYIGGYIGIQQGRSNTSVDGWDNRLPVERCYTNEETGTETCRQVHHEVVRQSFPGASTDGNVIGPMFGAYGGYNKQVSGAIVLGAELDGGWSGARDYVSVYANNATHKMPWNLNLTGRLGFLITQAQDTMLYVKGGLAIQNQQTTLTGPGGTASEDKTKAGWTLGGGIEHKFTQRLTGRVEGMYSKVSDQTVSIPGASTTLYGGSWNAKAGLSWSFN